jgi:hypothetical protein
VVEVAVNKQSTFEVVMNSFGERLVVEGERLWLKLRFGNGKVWEKLRNCEFGGIASKKGSLRLIKIKRNLSWICHFEQCLA